MASKLHVVGLGPGDRAHLTGQARRALETAALGAPSGHDFGIVSLSDLLPLWDVIEKRPREADMFATVFIGSSAALAQGGRMIPPRGYERRRKPCAV